MVRQLGGSRPALRERLLDAAVEEIAASGIDRVSVKPLCARAGLTTGALYRRWAGLDALLHDTWVERLWPVHREALEAMVGAIDAREDHAPALTRVLERPSAAQVAALDLVLSARRRGATGARVREDLDTWTRDTATHRRALEDAVSIAALVWGAQTLAIAGRPGARDWGALLPRLDADGPPRPEERATRDRPRGHGDGDTSTQVPDLVEVDADPLRTRLIAAAADVIAREGVAATTVAKVGAEAGTDGTAIYARFAGVEELLTETIRAHLSARRRREGPILLGALSAGDGDRLGSSVVAELDGRLEHWRLLSLETHLVARHDRGVHAAQREVLEREEAVAIGVLRPADEDERRFVVEATHLFQAFSLGLAVAQDALGLPVDRGRLLHLLAEETVGLVAMLRTIAGRSDVDLDTVLAALADGWSPDGGWSPPGWDAVAVTDAGEASGPVGGAGAATDASDRDHAAGRPAGARRAVATLRDASPGV